jgi:hypothetical protein
VSWENLRSEVEHEFGEHSRREFDLLLAWSARSARLNANAYERVKRWRALNPERYAESMRSCPSHQAPARKLRTVRDAFARMRARAPVACANPRCGVVFLPYRRDTRYCTKACRTRASSARAARVRRADPAKHQAQLAHRRARHAQGFNA